jgi:hypothetical protein
MTILSVEQGSDPPFAIDRGAEGLEPPTACLQSDLGANAVPLT